jgi:hypothetical protein
MSILSSWWKAFPHAIPPARSHFYHFFNDSEDYNNFLQGRNSILGAEMLELTKASISKKQSHKGKGDEDITKKSSF